MKTECKRKGIEEIQIFERYPSLFNRDPARLPGIEELQELAKGSFLVASDDLLHHGAAYGVEASDLLAQLLCGCKSSSVLPSFGFL